jgi:hypothetical protein
MAATHLVHRAKSLRDERPETSPTYRRYGLSPKPSQADGYCARRDHPAAYREIMDTIDHLQRNLPEELRVDLGREPAWTRPDAALVVSASDKHTTALIVDPGSRWSLDEVPPFLPPPSPSVLLSTLGRLADHSRTFAS